MNTTYKEIWDTLSAVDVRPFTKKMNGLDYISWARTWSILMHHYPTAKFEFLEPTTYLDGTVCVHCWVSIGECTRTMFLPVMEGYRHSAKPNPDARDISDAQMRCLVKCLALFGLGFELYLGEELPEAKPESNPSYERETNRETLIDEIRVLFNVLPPEKQNAVRKHYDIFDVSDLGADKLDEAHKKLMLTCAKLGNE